MSTFADVCKFDSVHSFACGKHMVRIEFSDETFKEVSKYSGETVEKKEITFYDVEAKTKLTLRWAFSKIHFLYGGFDRMVEEMEGMSEPQMKKYVAEHPVPIYVSKDEKYGKQYSPYPTKG